MDRKFSDEQIEHIARNLLKDFAPDDETLDEIAESPRLWWNVRNRIETEKARRTPRRWFAALRPQILAFGALAVLICLGLTALFLSSGNNSNSPIARQSPVRNESEEVLIKAPEDLPNITPNIDSGKREISKNPPPAKASVPKFETKAKFVARNRVRENRTRQAVGSPGILTKPAEETKTDFIALSYAAATDSGQVVRVKVPSSMMVSLGVKTTVEKESELVSAEVVIGDDGLARAIRFIR